MKAPLWLTKTSPRIQQSLQHLSERVQPVAVWSKLQAMALLLHLPQFRHHLQAKHPLGARRNFKSSFQFSTRDRSLNLHARFDGAMRVGIGVLSDPDVTLRFRTVGHLADFFADGDLFQMLLYNDVELSGNLSALAKFGHLSTDIKLRGKALPPKQPSQARSRWQDLPAPAVGEPCLQDLGAEATFLEDPYLASYSLDDFPRVKRLLWAHREIAPQICTERARLVTEFSLGDGKSGENRQYPVLRQARALSHVLRHKKAVIHEDDVLLGTTSSHRIGVVLYPEFGASAIWPELLTMQGRELNPYLISEDDRRILDREVLPFWIDGNIKEWTRHTFDDPEALRLDERFVLYFLWKSYAVSHTIADFPAVLGRGLVSIGQEAKARRKVAASPDQQAFYEGLATACEGVMTYARNLADRAREVAAGADAARKRELLELAAICERVPAGPVETLKEALQSLWLLFVSLHQESMNAGLSLGRLDVWLQPYFEREMAACTDPQQRTQVVEQAIESVSAFMLKATDHLPMVPDIGNHLFGGSSSDQAVTLGGVKPDGSDAVCDMTWVFLKATEMLRLRDPNVNARYAAGVNSAAYLRRLCEVNCLTRATPSIHNDAAMVPALINDGFSAEEARDWAATGCVEPTVSGRHFGHTGSIMFNLVAPLEMALNDGVHPLLGCQVGPQTGDASAFADYQSFYQAYQTQLVWLIDRAVEGNNLLGRAHQQLHPTPLLSALFVGPMESAKDLIDGGAPNNSTGIANVGLSDVVDSLCAIKTLVFDQGRLSFEQLLAAVRDDFVGHETILAQIENLAPKLGQDHPLPAQVANELLVFIDDYLRARPHYRGGTYRPGYWSMSNHVAFGLLSGASPSGRRRHRAFTPGLTPSSLCKAGLTDQISSVASLDTLRMPNSLAFNVKVVPGSDSHAVTLDRMAAYVASYFELGGMQLQFNVASSALLRKAMKDPDAHRDLLVRISGYNAYFVELNRNMQLELIDRMEHGLGVGDPG